MSDPDPASQYPPVAHGSLYEIFSGIQGEGLLLGERQLFLRLAGCNLDCAYCDTPHARTAVDACRVEQTAGVRDFSTIDNPLTPEDAIAAVDQLDGPANLHHSVALTGGEPLVQAEFTAAVARGVKKRGLRVLLETNGSLPDALPPIIPFVDMVSMDVKLPSATGGPNILASHEAFLRRAASAEVYVKIVLTRVTSTAELLRAVRLIEASDPAIPLVLQPATKLPGVLPPSPAQVLEWQAQCRSHLRSVRVIPQCHKILGQF